VQVHPRELWWGWTVDLEWSLLYAIQLEHGDYWIPVARASRAAGFDPASSPGLNRTGSCLFQGGGCLDNAPYLAKLRLGWRLLACSDHYMSAARGYGGGLLPLLMLAHSCTVYMGSLESRSSLGQTLKDCAGLAGPDLPAVYFHGSSWQFRVASTQAIQQRTYGTGGVELHAVALLGRQRSCPC